MDQPLQTCVNKNLQYFIPGIKIYCSAWLVTWQIISSEKKKKNRYKYRWHQTKYSNSNKKKNQTTNNYGRKEIPSWNNCLLHWST